MSPKPRKTKSLVSLQHESNKKSQWDDDSDNSDDDGASTSSDPIFTLPEDIGVRKVRRTDADALYKGINDPKVAHCFPDTVYFQPFSLWRVHKLIDEALNPEKSWRRHNPSTTAGNSVEDVYEKAIQALSEMDLEDRLAKRGFRAPDAAPTPKKDKRPLIPTTYAITHQDVLIGIVELGFADPLTADGDPNDPDDPGFFHEAELCYWITAEYRQRGIMTKVLQRFMQWSWENFAQLERIGAGIYSTWNPASGKVVQKCGFEHEGVWIGGIRKDGEFGDLEQWVSFRPGGKVEQFRAQRSSNC